MQRMGETSSPVSNGSKQARITVPPRKRAASAVLVQRVVRGGQAAAYIFLLLDDLSATGVFLRVFAIQQLQILSSAVQMVSRKFRYHDELSMNPEKHPKANDYPLVAPNVSPAIKCFCIAKNIATDGNAARIEPAETRFHAVVHCPRKAATPTVRGAASSPWVRHKAQK